MSITWSQVEVIAPELDSTAVPTDTQTALLAIVDLQIDDDVWGDLANTGRKYLAAHLGSLYANASSAGGPVMSESLGPMSRSYGAVASNDSELATTKYGVLYLHHLGLLHASLGFVP